MATTGKTFGFLRTKKARAYPCSNGGERTDASGGGCDREADTPRLAPLAWAHILAVWFVRVRARCPIVGGQAERFPLVTGQRLAPERTPRFVVGRRVAVPQRPVIGSGAVQMTHPTFRGRFGANVAARQRFGFYHLRTFSYRMFNCRIRSTSSAAYFSSCGSPRLRRSV